MRILIICLFSLVILPHISFSESVVLYPSDDSYTSSYNQNTNYGSRTYLSVDNDAIDRSFVKWDVENINSEKVKNVSIFLYALGHQTGAYTYLILFELNNGFNWTENSIKWSNQPSFDKEINYICRKEPFDANNNVLCFIPENVPQGTEYIIDITNFTKEVLIKNTTLSLVIGQGSLDGNMWTQWASKENPNANYRPKLVIEYVPSSTTTTSTSTTATSSSTTTMSSTTSSTTPTSSTSTTKTTTTSSTIVATTTSTASSTSSTSTTSTTGTTGSSTTTPSPATTSTTLVNISRLKKPVVITGDGFWEMLFAAGTGYPVLVWEDGNEFSEMGQRNFLKEYGAGSIILIENSTKFYIEEYSNITYIASPGDFYHLRKGFVIADGNRTNAILASFIAKILNYTLVPITEINGSEFAKDTICDFEYAGCNRTLKGEEMSDYLLNITKKAGKGINHIVLANSDENFSAMSSLISGKAFPVAYETGVMQIDLGSGGKNEISKIMKRANDTAKDISKKGIIDGRYAFNQDFFVSVIGMPFIKTEDPWQDDFGTIQDGEKIFTDSPYYDINGDGYPDAGAGRFCCSPPEISLQIANSLIWEPPKKALIIGEYRLPENLDLMYIEGMTEGFATEWRLRNSGVSPKRIVEKRLSKNLSDYAIEKMKEALDLDFVELLTPEYWIKKANEFIGIDSLYQIKYGLLEKDWEKYEVTGPPALETLTSEKFSEIKDNYDMFFFFTYGNSSNIFMPSDDPTVLKTYNTSDTISHEEIHTGKPIFIFLENSMSGHPESPFLGKNSFSMIGSTGIVHDTFSSASLAIFLENSFSGKPLGISMKKIKFPFEFYGNKTAPGPTSLTAMKGMKLMQKESLQKILYGNPEISIHEKTHMISTGSTSSHASISGEFIEVSVSFELTPEITVISLPNASYTYPEFPNASFFILDPGKPVVPVFEKEFFIPSSSETGEIKITRKTNEIACMPPLFPGQYENISSFSRFPENDYWVDEEIMLDGRKRVSVNFVPMVYFNETGYVAEISNATFSLKYKAPMEILNLSAFCLESGECSITAGIKADGPVNMRLMVHSEDHEDIFENSSEIEGTGTFSFYFYPRSTGFYEAVLVAERNGTLAGPVSAYFRSSSGSSTSTSTTVPIFPNISRGFIGKIRKAIKPEIFENEVSTAFEKAYYSRAYERERLLYINPNITIEIEKNSSGKITALKYFNASVRILQESGIIEKSIKTPRGYFSLSMKGGTVMTSCSSACDFLRSALEDYEIILNEEISRINMKISSGELPLSHSFP